MGYKSAQAPAHLKKYIVNFWEGEIQASDKRTFKHIATASTYPQLLFYFQGGFAPAVDPSKNSFKASTYFFGQTSKYADYITNENASIFGIQFHPYAIPYLFSLSSEELTNEMVELRMLLGSKGQFLEERIFHSKNFEERVKIITDFFETRVTEIADKDKHLITTIHHINQVNGILKTEELAPRVHLSERQFERNFKTLTGFSPKSYARIVRFENALNNFAGNSKSLTDLALASGYYDQAHFNHDFKHFTGYSPKAYYESIAALME